MRIVNEKSLRMPLVLAGLAGCVPQPPLDVEPPPPLTLTMSIETADRVAIEYASIEPTTSLHFVQELDGYRAQSWVPADDKFRWVKEGEGERIERADGKPFDRVKFVIPIDYRALPKSYAPFSPFSDGSALIHSGQFHACLALPCKDTGPLTIAIDAPGQTVGVEGRRTPGRERFVSKDEGTNIFVGHLEPIEADGFIAIVDPDLPPSLRQHLDRSLPEAIGYFASAYGALSFRPELYVSIDDRPEPDGRHSTQGGTLPNQIFMHFDGADAKERLATGEPYWLDWFFAHEAAHLFQQDKIGQLAGSDDAAWLHEGGADAMAALALIERGDAERSYVQNRAEQAEASCTTGLAIAPLNRASAAGNFDLHYQCGLLIWLALDTELRMAGRDGLHDLNRDFFARVRNGAEWDQRVFADTARALGASPETLSRIERIDHGGYTDARSEVSFLAQKAHHALVQRGGG